MTSRASASTWFARRRRGEGSESLIELFRDPDATGRTEVANEHRSMNPADHLIVAALGRRRDRSHRRTTASKAFNNSWTSAKPTAKPGFEGDDVMGILATHPKLIREKIIVSIDKDMETIPSDDCRWGTDEASSRGSIRPIEADYYHMLQTLTGDTTDGYKGCPGIGPKKAEAILAGTFEDPQNCGLVVAAYEKAGLTEDDPIVQARMAASSAPSDYDFTKKEPILWNPPT